MPYTIEAIESDKDDHFSTTLAQNAIDYEDLAFPTDFSTTQMQKLLIHQISVMSDQALNWDITLWSDDGRADTSDIDSDAHIITISFLASDATQVAGANQYYYKYEPVQPIFYEDKDNSGELHVGLINRSVTAKDAIATSGFRVKFRVEPVL